MRAWLAKTETSRATRVCRQVDHQIPQSHRRAIHGLEKPPWPFADTAEAYRAGRGHEKYKNNYLTVPSATGLALTHSIGIGPKSLSHY